MKVTELQGPALDWAVAKCEGIELMGGRYNRLLVEGHMSRGQEMMAPYTPSNNWAQGGPIIEREGINLDNISYAKNPNWSAWTPAPDRESGEAQAYGSTPLIAAMRCYIAHKLGDEIEIPKELTMFKT